MQKWKKKPRFFSFSFFLLCFFIHPSELQIHSHTDTRSVKSHIQTHLWPHSRQTLKLNALVFHYNYVTLSLPLSFSLYTFISIFRNTEKCAWLFFAFLFSFLPFSIFPRYIQITHVLCINHSGFYLYVDLNRNGSCLNGTDSAEF